MARVERADMLLLLVPDVLLGADRAAQGAGRGARRAPRAPLSQQLYSVYTHVANSSVSRRSTSRNFLPS